MTKQKFINLISRIKLNYKKNDESLEPLFNELKKEEHLPYIKEELLSDNVDLEVFDVLLRAITAYDTQDIKKFIETLLKKNINSPKKVFLLCGPISKLKIYPCGPSLEKVFDLYYYNDFCKYSDKNNYKNLDYISLISHILFTFGEINYHPVRHKLAELYKHLRVSEPSIGEVAGDSLKKLDENKP